MEKFKGFPTGQEYRISIPGQFFTELLAQIDDLGELKLILYFFWRLDRTEDSFRYMRRRDFLEDDRFLSGLAENAETAQKILEEALNRAVERGLLLEATLDLGGLPESYYFLNSSQGRAAVRAIAAGEWRPGSSQPLDLQLHLERPNIFILYEQNIGPLTPLIAEALGEAEDIYPQDWIAEAFEIAVRYNKRSWRYIEAILTRWQSEGRDEKGKNRRDPEEDRRKYVEGKYSDFIEH